MTAKDFYQLDEMEQAEAVWAGTHIGNREDETHGILLYSLDGGMYVEAFYHREYNVLRRFRSFSSTDHLQPYTEQINIVNLLNGKSKEG